MKWRHYYRTAIMKKYPTQANHLRIKTSSCVAAIAAFLAMASLAQAQWTPTYCTDLSSDPGWITANPSQFYWDSSSGRYYAQIGPEGGQYAYVGLPAISAYRSFKLEFDLTIVREDYAGGISIGLTHDDVSFSGVPALWVNFAQGSGGDGATVGYNSDTISNGHFPGAYDVLTILNITYHNEIIYDRGAQSLQWNLRTSGGALVGSFSATGVSTFTGLNRLLVQNDNTGGGTAAAYLDNVCISQGVLIVPGTANPWLAGMTNGGTACGAVGCLCDTAPAQSPILFAPVVTGTVLTFSVIGSTDHGGDPLGLSPDGGPLQPHIAENGIGSNNVPISALVGVFLDDSLPALSPAPAEFSYQPAAQTLAPGLRQVFFIGDGLTGTGSGTQQQFVVPQGATRLFLGTQDGCKWSDNGGSFTVSIDTHPLASIHFSRVAICWGSLVGGSYQVQYSTALNPSVWNDLGTPVAGTGSTVCVEDPIQPGEARFYRVVTLP